MTLDSNFSDMLNEYVPLPLLRSEFEDRNYVYKHAEKDDDWGLGSYVVPFQGARASSVQFGALPASTDIAQSQYVRGTITDYVEMTGSLIFNDKDIMLHGKVNEQNLLKLLPQEISDMLDMMAKVTDINLLSGKAFMTVTADGTAGGEITVDRPDYAELGMKVSIDDDDSNAVSGYVTGININTSVLTIKDARSGGVAVDLSDYDVAQNAKVYLPSQQTAGFSSIKEALLSAVNGGSATLYGQTKTAYPDLQAVNVDGSTITRTNLLKKIFRAFVEIRKLGKGKPTEVWVSYKHWATILENMEDSKGAFNIVPGSDKVESYNWQTVMIGSMWGALKFVALDHMPDDCIIVADWASFKFASNGSFRKHQDPDGNNYHKIRNTTGYQYVHDVFLFGDLVVHRPRKSGIIHDIPAYDVDA